MTRTWLVLALCACGESVDVEPVGDYSSWDRLDVTGNAPGHSDSYRIIYFNAIARDADLLYLGYPEGSIFVKEVHELDGDQPGPLRYTAIMRRIGEVTRAFEDEGGWLFTEDEGPGTEEKYYGFCWSRCHVAAPYNGAWYDYRKR